MSTVTKAADMSMIITEGLVIFLMELNSKVDKRLSSKVCIIPKAMQ